MFLSVPVYWWVLDQLQIVIAQTGQENYTRDIIETFDPLPSLVPLSAHVYHLQLDPLDVEHVLYYTRSLDPRPGDIIL